MEKHDSSAIFIRKNKKIIAVMLERSFSISTYRIDCFEFCRRAYFYRYIFSWGGWEKFADPAKKKAYHLKNLKKSDEWLSSVFRESIKKYVKSLSDPGHHNIKSLFYVANLEFEHKWNEALKSTNYSDSEGKNSSISELYYKELPPSQTKESLAEKFKSALDGFANSELRKEISEIPYLHFRDLQTPEKFELNGATVYVSPDLLWFSEDKPEITCIHLGGFREIRNWDIQATLSAIFAEKKSKRSNIITRSVFFNPLELTVWAQRSHSETIELIGEKSMEMIEFDGKFTKNPPEKEDIEKCKKCEFREIC